MIYDCNFLGPVCWALYTLIEILIKKKKKGLNDLATRIASAAVISCQDMEKESVYC